MIEIFTEAKIYEIRKIEDFRNQIKNNFCEIFMLFCWFVNNLVGEILLFEKFTDLWIYDNLY